MKLTNLLVVSNLSALVIMSNLFFHKNNNTASISDNITVKRSIKPVKPKIVVENTTLFPDEMMPNNDATTEVSDPDSKYNKILKNMFANQGHRFEKAADAHGIPVDILLSICLWETGEGTSEMLRKNNNPGGNMVYNKSAKKWEGRKFESLEEGLDFAAYNLSVNYWNKGLRTISDIRKKYAPSVSPNSKDFNDFKNLNVHWVKGVTKMRNKVKSV